MAEGEPAQYFRRTSLFWMLSVTFGVAHLTCIVFAPGQIPFHYFGPYGSFCRYLVDHHAGSLYKGWWACLAVHVVEAFVALKVCRYPTIQHLDFNASHAENSKQLTEIHTFRPDCSPSIS
ncbi:transmembrane protein 254 isoform X3 [Brachionichthys hirsutus]|uniref:transmembrane protein 254 isoform X3 n=1 Tax=Brachionichthys hirsutus TaxID=412623 RepID=UPI0036053017